MSDAQALLADLKDLDHVDGAVVWRAGEAPVGKLAENVSPVAPGLLASGIGTMEQVVETVGLGQVDELWFLTEAQQGLAVRLGDWQAIIVVGLDADIDGLRNAVTERLERQA
ncbi:MAG: hypothetical protein OXG33_01060 [Chloroflexi bacterium]|nr:hypothetical protein [Chloroflexota bacterium]